MGRGSGIDTKGSFFLSSVVGEFHNLSIHKKDIKVLDFGCGSGQLVSQLTSIGYSTYGCDIEKGWEKPYNNNSNHNNLKIISSMFLNLLMVYVRRIQ